MPKWFPDCSSCRWFQLVQGFRWHIQIIHVKLHETFITHSFKFSSYIHLYIWHGYRTGHVFEHITPFSISFQFPILTASTWHCNLFTVETKLQTHIYCNIVKQQEEKYGKHVSDLFRRNFNKVFRHFLSWRVKLI